MGKLKDRPQKDSKLRRLETAQLVSIPRRARSLFAGHLEGDEHLYQAPLAADAVVITQDRHQVAQRNGIRKRLGVEVFALVEVVSQDPPG